MCILKKRELKKMIGLAVAAMLMMGSACSSCMAEEAITEEYTDAEAASPAVEDAAEDVIEVDLAGDLEGKTEEEIEDLVSELYESYCEEALEDPERIEETTYETYTTQYVEPGTEFDCGKICYQGYEMKYGIQVIGDPDENGQYPLYIALHGGGEAEAEENDEQWEDMFFYYRDSVKNGIYVNIRGISDTWNLHFLDASYYMYDRLIEDMMLFYNADPNRIYVLGFSAGGDGVYQVSTHMADRFAAANMSSGHPNGVSVINLANLPILLQAGIRDNYFDRNTITVEYGDLLDAYAEAYGFGYENQVYIHVPEGHNYEDNDWDENDLQQIVADNEEYLEVLSENEKLAEVLEDPDVAYEYTDEVNEQTQQAVEEAGIETTEVDSNAVRWVSQYTRNPFPEKLVWDLDTRAGERTVESFYYLKASEDAKGVLKASYDEERNAIYVDTSEEEGDFSILFNPMMLDLSKPVSLYVDDMVFRVNVTPSEECIRKSIEETSDPYRVYAAEVSYSKLLQEADASRKADEAQETETSATGYEETEASVTGYGDRLFDASYIHAVDIVMADEDWSSLKADPLNGEKYHADITIDGECFRDVAVSTKGSLSLRTALTNEGVPRYSLKIGFDKYDKAQTYYGLDSLCLNNNITDASEMKDYIAYFMFRNMGISAPLASYVKITVNGEAYGLFLAVEDVKKGFLNRNFDGEGQLYKPEAKQLTQMNEASEEKLEEALKNGTLNELPSENNASKIWALDEYSSGADLIYTGDSFENYPDIFENAQLKVNEDDEERVVEALKNLSEGNIEAAVDAEEVMRYFIVHSFTNNLDSYTGPLNHNYILYENDGKLQMLPWDYNLYTVMMTDESLQKNYPDFTVYSLNTDIDTPLVVSLESRPMWGWIVNDETYLEQYHTLYDEFLTTELESGEVAEEIERVNDMIRGEIAEDPSVTFTLEEHDAVVADLLEFVNRRTKAIREQLTEK